MTGDPDLDHLQCTYGQDWRIWRTPNWWMANPRKAGPPPTLMERTPEELEERMKVPGRAIGRGMVPWQRSC